MIKKKGRHWKLALRGQALGMPGPMGTPGQEAAGEKYRERSRQAGRYGDIQEAGGTIREGWPNMFYYKAVKQ